MYWHRQTQTAMLWRKLAGPNITQTHQTHENRFKRWGSTSSSPILQTFKVRPRRRTSIWPSMSSRWGVHCVTQWKSDRIGHNFGKKSRNSFTQLLAMAVDSLLRSWRLAAFQCFDSLWIWDRSRSWLVRILSWCTMYFSNCGWNSPLSCLICLQHLASWFQSPKSSLSLFVSFAMILSAYRSRLRCAELCCQHAVAGVAFMRWVSA